MPDTTNRRFAVRARDADHHHAKLVAEPSFEAAAVAYLQDADLAEGQDLSIVVRDLRAATNTASASIWRPARPPPAERTNQRRGR